ncbi:MAG: hypothetical protein D6736_22085, partial [Nitrospinota bacterium]
MTIPTGKAERVVLIVCDGLRPDFVSPTLTPTLCRLAGEGTVCADHHAVFPSMTRVNVSSVITGVYPHKHGLMGNAVYVPEINPHTVISTGDYPSLYQWHHSPAGPLLRVPDIGEYLAAAGKRTAVISTGSGGSAFLLHHRVEEHNGILINPVVTLPADFTTTLTRRWGPFPPEAAPNIQRNEHAITLFLDFVLPELRPDLTILWLSEPDKSLHAFSLTAEKLHQAIRHLDTQIARIWDELQR